MNTLKMKPTIEEDMITRMRRAKNGIGNKYYYDDNNDKMIKESIIAKKKVQEGKPEKGMSLYLYQWNDDGTDEITMPLGVSKVGKSLILVKVKQTAKVERLRRKLQKRLANK